MLQVWPSRSPLQELSSESEPLALPVAGRGKNQPRNNNARPYGRGQANNIDLNEAQDQPATMMGTLLVNSVPASVYSIREHRILLCQKSLHTHTTFDASP